MLYMLVNSCSSVQHVCFSCVPKMLRVTCWNVLRNGQLCKAACPDTYDCITHAWRPDSEAGGGGGSGSGTGPGWLPFKHSCTHSVSVHAITRSMCKFNPNRQCQAVSHRFFQDQSCAHSACCAMYAYIAQHALCKVADADMLVSIDLPDMEPYGLRNYFSKLGGIIEATNALGHSRIQQALASHLHHCIAPFCAQPVHGDLHYTVQSVFPLWMSSLSLTHVNTSRQTCSKQTCRPMHSHGSTMLRLASCPTCPLAGHGHHRCTGE